MRLAILGGILLSCWCWVAQAQSEQAIYDDFKNLLVDIRTQQLPPYEAKRRFQQITTELKQRYPSQNIDSAYVQLVFPLRSKNYRSVGGRGGNGFRGNGFDLFDHSVQGSHPAQDIFIYDRNQDCIDDGTGEYVDVVAVSDGIVISSEMDWQPGMDYRGGNYVWLYDFQTGGLWYFAHLREVYVYPGQKIKAGDKMGEVGRTGFNAAASRSDTHLHLMHLAIEYDGSPRPINHYGWLKNARTVYTTSIPFYNPVRRMLFSEKIAPLTSKNYENSVFSIKFPEFKFEQVSLIESLTKRQKKKLLRF